MCIFCTQRQLSAAAFRFFWDVLCLPRNSPLFNILLGWNDSSIKCWWLDTQSALLLIFRTETESTCCLFTGLHSATDKPLASIHQNGFSIHFPQEEYRQSGESTIVSLQFPANILSSHINISHEREEKVLKSQVRRENKIRLHPFEGPNEWLL